MSRLTAVLSSRWGAIVTGVVLGAGGALLVYYGNPGNMGMCVACFTRDTAGALGLHRAAPVQYLRPEIIGLVCGALLAGWVFREFRARGGAAPVLRFVLGAFAAIGALVFLGCPWRAFMRLGGGDWNALLGIAGLVAGVAAGVFFLKRGFSLGRNRPAAAASGYILPVLMLGLLALALWQPLMGLNAEKVPAGPIFSSTTGPGSQRVGLWVALGAGLLIGFLAQRSRFCTVGAFRNVMVARNFDLFLGVAALVAAAAAVNLALGQFRAGFDGQPIAHGVHVWNFAGMLLAGLAFTLGGGCPGRQLILAGEGDLDAGVFVLGLFAGTAFAHNFNLASSPAGPAELGPAAVVIGLLVCAVAGLSMKEVLLAESHESAGSAAEAAVPLQRAED